MALIFSNVASVLVSSAWASFSAIAKLLAAESRSQAPRFTGNGSVLCSKDECMALLYGPLLLAARI